MDSSVVVLHESIWPIIFYYVVSLLIFISLCYGKVKVTQKRKRLYFVLYSLFVIFCASVQFALFSYGTRFSQAFLHLNLDVDLYDSIYWGALAYSLLYLIALPKNIYVKQA